MTAARLHLGLLALLAIAGCPQSIETSGDLQGAPDAAPSADAGPGPDAGGRCGDGRADPGEACDGADLEGTSCGDLGRGPGVLACNRTCTGFVLDDCGPACAPDCAGRSCGPDPACGASCGSCAGGAACAPGGTCVQTCAPGSFRCLPSLDAYQPCGLPSGASLPELGPPVTCGGVGGCEAATGVRCALPADCRPAQMVVVVDRSVALARDSRWSVLVDALETRVRARARAGRFGLRELPSPGCAASALPSLDATDLGRLRAPDGDTARPIAAALAGLELALAGDVHGREVLLVVGGGETCEDEQVALQRAARLHWSGVRVHVLLAVPSSPARAFLDRLAEAGGTGDALVPGDDAGLLLALDAVFEPLCEDPITQIDAGYYHACRRTADREVACWGRDLSNESSAPPGDYRQVSAGTDFTCAVTEAGELRCWGRDQFRQTQSPAGRDFVQVSAGNGHACALRTNGRVACWGRNEDGQGEPPDERFDAIGAGYFFTCGLRASGEVSCWGFGRPRFTQGGLRGLSVGGSHACAIDANGRAVCAGSNGFGESDPPPSARLVHLAAGDDHTCGILEGGAVRCWGSDIYGESTPPEGLRFRQLSADNDYTCGVTERLATGPDTIVCWGSGSNGQTTPPP